jgi:hypothetical protein
MVRVLGYVSNFRADSDELHFVLKALMLREIFGDFELINFTHQNCSLKQLGNFWYRGH